jgi:hypothetical protein
MADVFASVSHACFTHACIYVYCFSRVLYCNVYPRRPLGSRCLCSSVHSNSVAPSGDGMADVSAGISRASLHVLRMHILFHVFAVSRVSLQAPRYELSSLVGACLSGHSVRGRHGSRLCRHISCIACMHPSYMLLVACILCCTRSPPFVFAPLSKVRRHVFKAGAFGRAPLALQRLCVSVPFLTFAADPFMGRAMLGATFGRLRRSSQKRTYN